jgi:hypothetical protein
MGHPVGRVRGGGDAGDRGLGGRGSPRPRGAVAGRRAGWPCPAPVLDLAEKGPLLGLHDRQFVRLHYRSQGCFHSIDRIFTFGRGHDGQMQVEVRRMTEPLERDASSAGCSPRPRSRPSIESSSSPSGCVGANAPPGGSTSWSSPSPGSSVYSAVRERGLSRSGAPGRRHHPRRAGDPVSRRRGRRPQPQAPRSLRAGQPGISRWRARPPSCPTPPLTLLLPRPRGACRPITSRTSWRTPRSSSSTPPTSGWRSRMRSVTRSSPRGWPCRAAAGPSRCRPTCWAR